MKQLLMVAALTGLLTTMSGCASMRSGCDAGCDNSCSSCSSCQSCSGQGSCGSGCQSSQCGGGARGCFAACKGGCATGCRPSPLHWQQGGSDYAHKLSYGMLKHGQVPQNPGPQTASTAYPYYTNRGPRDFLAADPPSIGR